MKMFLSMRVQKMLNEQKVQDEFNFLKQLLENLGFSVIKEVKDTKVIISNATRYFLTDVFTVSIKDDVVGECVFIVPSNRPAKVNIILNSFTVPEETITKLLLLGFEVEHNNWLEYEKEIR